MTLRWISNMSLALGVALVIAAVVLYFLPEDGPGTTIERPEREPGTLMVGRTSNLFFEIDNPTRHAVRVVGLGEC